MAGRQNKTDSPNRTVRAKKSIGTISILICVVVAALAVNGVIWTTGRNGRIRNAEEPLSELQSRASIPNIELSAVKTAAYSANTVDGGSDGVVIRSAELQDESAAQSNKHGVVLDNRENMTLTGVKDVSSFDETKIVLQTELGQLTITGRLLHILEFSPKTGDFRMHGTIDSLVYADANENRGNLMERLRLA